MTRAALSLSPITRSGQKFQKRSLFVAIALMIGFAAVIAPRVGLMLAEMTILSLAIIPRPELGLYLTAALLPFEQLATLSAGMSILRPIGFVVIISWAVRLFRTGRTSIDLNEKRYAALFLFLAFSAWSVTLSIDPSAGLVQIITLLSVALFFFAVHDLLDKPLVLDRIILIMVIAAVAAVLAQFSLVLTGVPVRQAGIYGDPNHSALNLVVALPLCFFLIYKADSRLRSLAAWGGLFLIAAGAFLLLSRGASVALLLAFVSTAAGKYLKRKHRVTALALVTILLATLVFASSVDDRFSIQEVSKSGGAGRLAIWSTGLKIFSDHQLIGAGVENFRQRYMEYSSKDPAIDPRLILPIYAHNMYLEAAVETGLLGLAALLVFLGLSLVRITSIQRMSALVSEEEALKYYLLLVSLIAFMAGSFFLSGLARKMLWFFLAIATRQFNRSETDTLETA